MPLVLMFEEHPTNVLNPKRKYKLYAHMQKKILLLHKILPYRVVQGLSYDIHMEYKML